MRRRSAIRGEDYSTLRRKYSYASRLRRRLTRLCHREPHTALLAFALFETSKVSIDHWQMSLSRLALPLPYRHLWTSNLCLTESRRHFTSTARLCEEGHAKKRFLVPDHIFRLQRSARNRIKRRIARSPTCNQWITESPLRNFLGKLETIWFGRITHPPALTPRVGMFATSPPMTSIPPPPATTTLSKADGPLVWIDCE